jgi:hypothetical protein
VPLPRPGQEPQRSVAYLEQRLAIREADTGGMPLPLLVQLRPPLSHLFPGFAGPQAVIDVGQLGPAERPDAVWLGDDLGRAEGPLQRAGVHRCQLTLAQTISQRLGLPNPEITQVDVVPTLVDALAVPLALTVASQQKRAGYRLGTLTG